MTTSHLIQRMAALMVVGLSLSLFAPLANAGGGSKGDSFNYIINSGNAGPNSGIAALSTAYQLDQDQPDFKFGECKWEQDFKMLQAASTKIIDPGFAEYSVPGWRKLY